MAELQIVRKGEMFVTLIDDEDVERVRERGGWYLAHHGYVVNSRERGLYLHRFIVGCTKGDGVCVDHLNHDKLDNRRANLLAGTQADNMRNVSAHHGAVSEYRGVHFDTRTGRWKAHYQRLGVRFYATCTSEEEAAWAARVMRGES